MFDIKLPDNPNLEDFKKAKSSLVSQYVKKSANAVIDSSAGTIGGMNWPAQYNEAIPLYCAIRILMHRQSDMTNLLAKHSDSDAEYTDTDGAPLSQQEYEALTSNDGWEVVRYLVETAEDPELANAKMAQISGEQQQFVTEYQWIGTQLPQLQGQYDRVINAGRKTGE